MGWSIDIVRVNLTKIFKEAGRKYRITHPQSAHAGVVVEYSGSNDSDNLPLRFKTRIAELFPDFVYIDYVLVVATDDVVAQMEWDN